MLVSAIQVLQRRYVENRVYTNVADDVLVVNPFRYLPSLYDDSAMKMYQGCSRQDAPPHVFEIAERAWVKIKKSPFSEHTGGSGSGRLEVRDIIDMKL